jgi:Asp-tRNA(Asn)/Glu-tRNA(Gln) amidotransferase A subunit family amidase
MQLPHHGMAVAAQRCPTACRSPSNCARDATFHNGAPVTAGAFLDHDPHSASAGWCRGRGRQYSALDAYRALYELARLKRETDIAFRLIDVLMLPTTGTIYEKAAVAADPFRLNANLGLYTSFVNLLDLTAIAVPAGIRKNGLPFGISLIGPAFADRALLDLAARFHE